MPTSALTKKPGTNCGDDCPNDFYRRCLAEKIFPARQKES
jgi:hypothetical protein